jgi:copper transport protein
LGAIAVLGITAALVATAPPGAATSGPAEIRRVVDNNVIDLVVDPARAGATELHLYVTPLDGTSKTIDDVTATLTKSPELKGPLNVDLLRAGPAHFVSNGLFLPFDGKWTLELALRSGEFDQTRTTLDFSIKN